MKQFSAVGPPNWLWKTPAQGARHRDSKLWWGTGAGAGARGDRELDNTALEQAEGGQGGLGWSQSAGQATGRGEQL